MSYGNKPNHTFFLFYGFVTENNENDYVTISVNFDPEDKSKQGKDDMMDYATDPRKCKLSIDADGARFLKVMKYLRYVEYDGDIEYLKKVGSNRVHAGS